MEFWNLNRPVGDILPEQFLFKTFPKVYHSPWGISIVDVHQGASAVSFKPPRPLVPNRRTLLKDMTSNEPKQEVKSLDIYRGNLFSEM